MPLDPPSLALPALRRSRAPPPPQFYYPCYGTVLGHHYELQDDCGRTHGLALIHPTGFIKKKQICKNMIKASQWARSSNLNELFRQFHSFTGSDEVVVPYVQDSDKFVEELKPFKD